MFLKGLKNGCYALGKYFITIIISGGALVIMGLVFKLLYKCFLFGWKLI